MSNTGPHEPLTLREAEKIHREENPVCLGVRLLQEVANTDYYLVLPDEYYKRAVEKICEQVNNPHFFIFCIDQKWVEKNLLLPYPHTFITQKPDDESACEDLWLMSFCKHFIIPNSTYHWWGAWLSENKGKIVIAPAEGFHNKDIIPDGWQTINFKKSNFTI